MRELDLFPSRSGEARVSLLATDRRPSPAFDQRYYDAPDGTYGGYTYDGRYVTAAHRIMTEFDLRPGDRVLEIGCAKGFVLVELQRLGMKVRGIEISRYAVENCHPELKGRVTLIEPGEWPIFWRRFDLVICKEVLPHIAEEWLPRKIRYLRAVAKDALIEIQCAETPEAAEKMRAWDVTHLTCKPAVWWRELLTECGYAGAVNFKALF